MRIIRLLIACLLIASPIHAATYYMGGVGDDFANLQAAMAGMAAGDTLIIRDGTYTGATNVLDAGHRPPVGSAEAYTIIKAETDGAVIFDGENTNNMFRMGLGQTSYTDLYWKFEGIEWKNTPLWNMLIEGSAYVKFLRCGFSQDNNNGDGANVYVRYCQYILLEDCYAYGGKRYKFQFAAGSETAPTRYNIARRCVARLDAVNATDNIGGFMAYTAQNCEFQNCITIDSDQSSHWVFTLHQGSFGVLTTSGPSTDIYFRGCIAVNNHFGGFFTASNADSTVTVIDSAVLDTGCYNSGSGSRPNWFRGSGEGSTKSVTNCTFVKSTGDNSPGVYQDGNETSILKNCIITLFTMARAVSGWATQDYNSYYANTSNNNSGAHDITDVDPLAASLLYPVRIEAGSALDGAGESGADIGATILKKIGTSGTLYGETGYNTTTDDDLWPFPNEALIKTKMAAYTYDDGSGGDPEITGARGFCATGKQLNGTDDITLTSYIWEYLGNQIPSDIYGSGSTWSGVSSFGVSSH